MLKSTAKTVFWIAIALALLTTLVGVSPTEAGEFVRGLWGDFMEFVRTIFKSAPSTTSA